MNKLSRGVLISLLFSEKKTKKWAGIKEHDNQDTHFSCFTINFLLNKAFFMTPNPKIFAVCSYIFSIRSNKNSQIKGFRILTSWGSLPRSSREIFFSFMSDQNIVPVCIFEAVATTFSTIIGTLSKPCSFRSATNIEWRFEMIRKAAVWSEMHTKKLYISCTAIQFLYALMSD